MNAEKLLNQPFGPYFLESILGSGGMAVVYRARTSGGQTVAVKVLFPPPGAGPDVLARFEREARTATRLNHPGIVRVLAAGQAEGYAYVAMTLVEGETLADRLARSGPLDEATAADLAWQLADALDYAHRQGVVHRDVKPSNILLTPDGRALLTDFGVALALDEVTLTLTGHTVGTPAYMAPEQATGNQKVDGRADLYALGVVLYQMVTGRTPFQGSTPQVLHAHVYTPPPMPSAVARISPAMEAVILRALAKEPGRRFQTGAAMATALTSAGQQAGTSTHPIAPVRSTAGPGLAWRWLWLALVPLAAVMVVWQLTGTPSPAPPATATPTPAGLARPVLATPSLWPTATASAAPTATLSPVPLPFLAGSLLKSSGPGVFRLSSSGVLQHVYDLPTFLAFGFVEADIQTVEQAMLEGLPRGGELIRLVQGQDQPLDWVVAGRRWRINRWQATLARDGYKGLPPSPADALLLAALPLALSAEDLPPGTLLKTGGTDVYRLFEPDILRRFASPELVTAYGYSPTEVVELPDEVLPLYRIGPPLTRLLRSEDSEAVFLIDSGRRQPMPAGDALWAMGYGVEDISVVPADYLAGFALVEPTPTPAAPPPQDTPSPAPLPSPTPCPQPVDPALAEFVAGHPLRDQLGCPRAAAVTVSAAWQPFEHGFMLWREDSNLVYVLYPDKTWFSTGDTWREGDSAYDPAIAAPSSLYQPVRGFGKVWREHPGVRETLGWATAEEKAFYATLQVFTGGSAWYDGQSNNRSLLLSDGTYTLEQEK